MILAQYAAGGVAAQGVASGQPAARREDDGMARHPKAPRQAEADRDEAMRIARGTQRPGQTRAQTKLIARGIQKGIEQYKKQQSARARELDRKLGRARRQAAQEAVSEPPVVERVVVRRQHWLPWALLVLTWLASAAFWLLS